MSSSVGEKFPIPPVLPSLTDLLEKYLLDIESLPIHDPRYSRKLLPYTPDPTRLFSPSVNPVTSALEVERDPATGDITGIKESFDSASGATAKNSFSLRRIPGPPEESVRGSSTNFPFWPGGIPEPVLSKDLFSNDVLFDPKFYLTKHPKLSRGLVFESLDDSDEVFTLNKDNDSNWTDNIVKISDMLKIDDDILKLFDAKEQNVPKIENLEIIGENAEDANLIAELKMDSLPSNKENHVIKISDGPEKGEYVLKNTEWATMVNINSPVDDFITKVPNPACTYSFELDTFQKQAILHLEKQDCVFVAAHTSAGKTVVAEYAIALSLKHMTRSIYTSPIKALSNQKYRDLKLKFEDVGLLTGDIQINSKASCLIMTTEILQSMLYNGSDTIRDLEWVIFDEVHYINNAERGHVWEEVIIMLPSHVNIVLLSATVPNTLEFADWIGRIKKRKIYVISTTKRPVPLEHYLYTGTGGKSKDEMFLLVDANGNFIKQGYLDAMDAKKGREKKSRQMQGPKPGYRHQMGEKQEKNMWIGLIDHLSKKELLPVVAFTLSKKRCDQNAYQLMSQDLTTQREKGEIHTFIKKCMDRLQGTDKELPQVKHMTNLLKKGIGVHHSGILPLLKEVVEMLFAKSLVKLLFATETFAMGVNMPARSVVFDSIRKHDGTKFRDLVPSEYIQMAGRAGRRGLDTTGTVVILCKIDVPEMFDLQRMMLGKPTKLESQFKLTYSMILNLLRVEALRVQDMMKRSFSESLQLLNQSKYEESLRLKETAINDTQILNCMMCSGIESFYATSRDYANLQANCLKLIISHPNAKKMLNVGRILKISFKNYQNYIACLMKIDSRDSDKYVVFVLSDKSFPEDIPVDELEMKICLCNATDKISILEKTQDHKLLEIRSTNIIGISTKMIKVDGDKVIDNIKKREMPRFRGDPPGKSVMEVIIELQRITESGGDSLEFLSFMSDLGIKELKVVELLKELESLRKRVKNYPCLECPQFAEHFAGTFQRLNLMEEIARLKYLMSEEALQLHPEYQIRIEVLKQLGYIEGNNTVTLKGRVACEMGNHELMVTELLLENVFADKSIEDIVALLSSLVFQQKHCSEPSLTEDLVKGIKQFKEVAEKIGVTQKNCGLKETVGDYVDQFNFGLCEVVYQWSLGMGFDKIMELTDVQEGITVKCIQRLDETLRDVRNAARIIGDPNLYEKMEKASTTIKRDIVFAASLYTQ